KAVRVIDANHSAESVKTVFLRRGNENKGSSIAANGEGFREDVFEMAVIVFFDPAKGEGNQGEPEQRNQERTKAAVLAFDLGKFGFKGGETGFKGVHGGKVPESVWTRSQVHKRRLQGRSFWWKSFTRTSKARIQSVERMLFRVLQLASSES